MESSEHEGDELGPSGVEVGKTQNPSHGDRRFVRVDPAAMDGIMPR